MNKNKEQNDVRRLANYGNDKEFIFNLNIVRDNTQAFLIALYARWVV